MSIISPTIFSSAELKLPIDNINDIQVYIDKHEPDILRQILGYSLYKAFITGLDVATPDQKWIDLRDGSEYTDSSGDLEKYDGISIIIADYVYYKIISNIQNNPTDSGVVSAELENAKITSPRTKLVFAWNDMVKRKCFMDEFIIQKNNETPDTYENFKMSEIELKNTYNI